MPVGFILTSALGKYKARRIAEGMARSLARSLGVDVEPLLAGSYAELLEALDSGQAQIGWCPAAVCTQLESRARGIFPAVREGVPSYHAALVGRQDKRLSLDSLAGTRAAWVDRHSFGGYLLAMEYLQRQRIDPDKTFSSQTFYGSYPDAVAAVLEGRAEVSSVTVARTSEAAIVKTMAALLGPGASRLSVIAVTDSIPADALVVTRHLAPDLAVRAEQAFEQAGPNDPLCEPMACEGYRRARPGDYKVVALTRCLGLIDFHRRF